MVYINAKIPEVKVFQEVCKDHTGVINISVVTNKILYLLCFKDRVILTFFKTLLSSKPGQAYSS